MKIYFRKSFRPLVTRYIFVAVVIFLFVRIFTLSSWSVSFLFSATIVGFYILIVYLKDYHRRCIVVDEEGIEQVVDNRRVRIRWDEAVGIHLAETDLVTRKGAVRMRYAVLYDARRKRIAFSDFSLIGGQSIPLGADHDVVISDIARPEMLLAICAKKTSNDAILQELKGEEDGARVAQARVAAGSGEGGIVEPPHKEDRSRNMSLAGILILLGKVGGKLFKGLAGIFKTVKPGFAVASGAVYGIFFSWKFALALMLMLFVHEYGHVYAMKRSGLKVRGIYFIPFLGAAAVTDDSWRTREQQAYIALNGPLWGFVLTLLPLGFLFFMEGDNLALATGVAAWWSFINLFNLLPINPLDGGRLLSSLSYSVSGRAARTISFLAFLTCLVLTVVFEIYLFAILGIVGLLEFFSEMQVSRQARQIDLAGGADNVRAEGLARLKKLTRPLFDRKDELKLYTMDISRFNRLLVMARIKPMKGLPAVKWAALYILLTAAFVGIVLFLADRPEAAFITQLLR